MILLDILELMDSDTKLVLYSDLDDLLLINEDAVTTVPDKYRYCPVVYIGIEDDMLKVAIEV